MHIRETGVGICEWDRFVNKRWNDLYTRVVYRSLNYQRDKDFQDKIEDFVRQSLGKPFKLNASKLLRATNEGDHAQKIKETKSYFCSELVATALKRAGLLDPDKAASKYWPGDFSIDSQHLILLGGAQLGDEQIIDFSCNY